MKDIQDNELTMNCYFMFEDASGISDADKIPAGL